MKRSAPKKSEPARERPARPARTADGRSGAPRRPPARERSSIFTAANLRSLLWVVAIFLLIRTFVMEAFRIPSGSMEPTLLVGDFLFVNKVAYGPHIPFTGIALPGYRELQREDIAVYRSPDARDGHPTVVKRVVGVTGDTIYMRAGQLFVNGTAQRSDFVAQPIETHGAITDPDFLWQNRVALVGTRFGDPPERPTYDDWGPLLVPEQRFFTLGDHRHNSKDARAYGFVPRDNVRGRPMLIYFSLDFEALDVRWRRIGRRIR